MWGAPGTLIAARLHARLDGRAAVARGLGRERGRRCSRAAMPTGSGRSGCTDTRRGTSAACTASSGTSRRSLPLLDDDASARLSMRSTTAILERAAFVEDGLANWPPAEARAPGERERRDPAAVVPRSARDRLRRRLLPRRGARRSRARSSPGGPARIATRRAPAICHGTAGNGYALLTAFERTGDERWLERARRFAVHALAQVRRQRAARGRGRYSLFTGDLGVAAVPRELPRRACRVPGPRRLTRLAAVTPPSDCAPRPARRAHRHPVRERRRGARRRHRAAAAGGSPAASESAGGTAELVPWGTDRSSSGRSPRPSAPSPRRRSSATRTSTSSRPTRSSSGSRRRSSSTQRDGKLCARGVADDKGNLFVLVEAARQLAAEGALPVNVRFAFDGEEEIGGNSIVEWVEQDEGRADAALILDGAMVRREQPIFMVGVRGMVYLHLRVRTGTTDMHSGMFGAAALNATHALMTALCERRARRRRPPARRAPRRSDTAVGGGARRLGAASVGAGAADRTTARRRSLPAPPRSSTCGRSRTRRST